MDGIMRTDIEKSNQGPFAESWSDYSAGDQTIHRPGLFSDNLLKKFLRRKLCDWESELPVSFKKFTCRTCDWSPVFQVGALWSALAEYYIRAGHFQKVRPILFSFFTFYAIVRVWFDFRLATFMKKLYSVSKLCATSLRSRLSFNILGVQIIVARLIFVPVVWTFLPGEGTKFFCELLYFR